MYSMVMVMAMSSPAALPAGCFGKCSGNACHGAVACSCSGYSSCSGRCSGGCFGSLFSRNGCSGSRCHGSACNGCSGSRCFGSNGCSGSRCHGSACSGNGCSGSRCFGSMFRRNGCHGASDCCGVVASCTGCTGAVHTAPAKGAAPMPAEPKKAETKPPAASLDAPAKVLVSLPADANLTIDGHATTSTAAVRTFVSPTLEAGRDYQYTIKVEMVRDGKTVSESKNVLVRAGETTEVSFEALTVAAN